MKVVYKLREIVGIIAIKDNVLTSSFIFCNLTILFVNQDYVASVVRMTVNNGQTRVWK
jgi:hypothetical protein